jgi:hypothetical protein
MNKEQYIALLRSPSTINLNMVKGLEEISERFPYFQNAHILLAKQYHGHENIRYESYLKKAAAYAGNRDLLFRLINTPPPEIIHMKKEEQDVVSPFYNDSLSPAQEPAIPVLMEAVRDDVPEVDKNSEMQEENFSFPTEFIPVEEMSNDISSSMDNDVPTAVSENRHDQQTAKEIIERRLREIEQQSEWQQKETTIEQNDQPSATSEINDKPLTETAIPEQVKDPAIFTDNYEEKVPDINSEKVEVQSKYPEEKNSQPETNVNSSSEVHSFLDWLKIKNTASVPVEKPLEYFSDKDAPAPATDDILDKFIKTEPRIVPQRAEFYSPGNMARKSLEVHDDLVTETLARIYAGQGHLTEAIDSYRKLCLKYPEKSGYFAARISELEEEIRKKE